MVEEVTLKTPRTLTSQSSSRECDFWLLGFSRRPICARARSELRAEATHARCANMGELKMEKKGDAELAKITAEIDALKEEAAQVRLSLKRDALK